MSTHDSQQVAFRALSSLPSWKPGYVGAGLLAPAWVYSLQRCFYDGKYTGVCNVWMLVSDKHE